MSNAIGDIDTDIDYNDNVDDNNDSFDDYNDNVYKADNDNNDIKN